MSLLPTTSAVILAGGLGTRLRPVVADRPKVLAEVDGRPFLFNLLDALDCAGVAHVILATGYRAEAVAQAVSGRYRGLEVETSEEPSPLGTGGAIALAARRLRSPRALVLNGDSFCAANLRIFAAQHWARRGPLSMVVTPVEDASRYGRVRLSADGIVTSFDEKSGQAAAGLINAGIYLLEQPLLDDLPTEAVPLSFERQILPAWVGRGLWAHRSDGPFIDIGLPSTYAQAERFFAEVGGDA